MAKVAERINPLYCQI